MKDHVRGSKTRREMESKVELTVDGIRFRVPERSSVAAAILGSRVLHPTGWTPLCGIGVCWGCRATINGQTNSRSCLVTVTSGMRVQTELVAGPGEEP